MGKNEKSSHTKLFSGSDYQKRKSKNDIFGLSLLRILAVLRIYDRFLQFSDCGPLVKF